MTQSQDHTRLLLPYDPPLAAAIGGALPSIPSLWDRAKVFFERVIKEIGSAADFSKRWKVSRKERREVLGWLEPVESLVRSCLIVKAIAFLLMTPEGRKLMRDTPKMPMPEWPKPKTSDNHIVTIPHPGWSTIAAHRNALAERERLEAERAARKAATDRHDPANWACVFRSVGWKFPEDDAERPPPKKLSPVWISVLDPDPLWPVTDPARKPSGPATKDRPALKLARRIEAVARVLADPGKATWKLARFLARIPSEALDGFKDAYARTRSWWKHGFTENRQAKAHIRRAATVFLDGPQPDTG
jgi:hypothetical protein